MKAKLLFELETGKKDKTPPKAASLAVLVLGAVLIVAVIAKAAIDLCGKSNDKEFRLRIGDNGTRATLERR